MPSALLDSIVTPLPRNSETSRQILIVEDDVALNRFLTRELKSMNFGIQAHHEAESALESLKSTRFDLVLLDLTLPKMDGIAFLQAVHALPGRQCPILVLSAKCGTEDIVRALDQGADDWLSKPFSYKELQARIRSLLRRDHSPKQASSRVGDLVVNRAEHKVMRGSRRIDLTPREFGILEHLMNNVGKPVSRLQLMREVWNTAYDPKTNIVDVYMKYLRDKIDGDGEAKLIRTVRGVGYVLSSD